MVYCLVMSETPDKYQFFVQQIMAWYKKQGRHTLPWRHPNITPYEVWISEIMLQQTQVQRVIPFYTRFLARFPTVDSLASTNWDEFLPFYQGLGYYQRGRNMLLTAQQVVQQYQGHFPQDKIQLQQLPGIGNYTANAILSFAFDFPCLAFDTNQQRVWGRYLYGNKNARVDPEAITAALPTYTNFRQLNAAIMDFASLVYTKSATSWRESPLAPFCQFWRTQGKMEEQKVVKKSPFPLTQAQTVLVLHQQHRIYYSACSDRYQAFLLPAPLNSREKIQRYFLQKYALQLSVRPPYDKRYWQGKPTIFVRAQVLIGKIPFTSFAASQVPQPAYIADSPSSQESIK